MVCRSFLRHFIYSKILLPQKALKRLFRKIVHPPVRGSLESDEREVLLHGLLLTWPYYTLKDNIGTLKKTTSTKCT